MISVRWPTPNALSQRLEAVQRAATDPSSIAVRSYRADLAAIVQDDHEQKMLRGVDRYGRTRAPLAASTLKNRKRGPGPSLIPLNAVSRYITHHRVEWDQRGGLWRLHVGFEPILSKRGVNIIPFHETGAGYLPARPVMGITPTGMAKVRTRHQQLPLDILSTAGRFGTYKG